MVGANKVLILLEVKKELSIFILHGPLQLSNRFGLRNPGNRSPYVIIDRWSILNVHLRVFTFREVVDTPTHVFVA